MVISTALTAEPTNTAILQTGAKIVWADVESDTGLIDPNSRKFNFKKNQGNNGCSLCWDGCKFESIL